MRLRNWIALIIIMATIFILFAKDEHVATARDASLVLGGLGLLIAAYFWDLFEKVGRVENKIDTLTQLALGTEDLTPKTTKKPKDTSPGQKLDIRV